MKKPAITFFAPILLALVGLFLIATGFLPVDETKTSHVDLQANHSNSFDVSENFKRFENLLLSSTNVSGISDSINTLR